MRINFKSSKATFIIIICIACSSLSFGQDWTKYADSSIVNLPTVDCIIKVPGIKTGNRYILTLDDFNSFERLETKEAGVSVLSYDVVALGKDKGLITKECSGDNVDKIIRQQIKESPFLGFRVIFYNIKYNKSHYMSNAFIIEVKE